MRSVTSTNRTGRVDSVFSFPPVRMRSRMWVSVLVCKEWQHFVQNSGIDRCRGLPWRSVVRSTCRAAAAYLHVEVDWPSLTFSFASRLALLAADFKAKRLFAIRWQGAIRRVAESLVDTDALLAGTRAVGVSGKVGMRGGRGFIDGGSQGPAAGRVGSCVCRGRERLRKASQRARLATDGPGRGAEGEHGECGR